MIGLGALLFSAGLILLLALSYGLGMSGWVAGMLILAIVIPGAALAGWSDAGTLAVQVLAMGMTAALTLRSLLRHKAWQDRLAHDREDGDRAHQKTEGALQQLREQVATRGADVERGLKQYELIKRLAEAVSWEEMSPSLEKSLKHFFRADGWALYLVNEEGELELLQRRGSVPEVRAEDLARKDPYLHTFVSNAGIDQGRTVWALAMPLWRLHERIGLLLVRLPEVSPESQAQILADATAFSVNLIFAMAKAKLYRDLDRRSRTDGLTGLSRRGPFEERLREEVARATSFRSTFSILMIDIDHFKRLNDTYGHQIGDEVLRTVSQRLREGLYETDVIARYGGEEFIGLLPRSDPAGLRVKADQLRQRVANQPFVIGVEAVTVTISLGIAHFPRDGATAEAVLAAADRALYAAKAAGRNRVVEAASITS